MTEKSGIAPTAPTTSQSSYDDYVIEGLTLYEMYREPRHPIVDDSTTTLPIRIMNKDLSCPICLNIIQNTLTVMECLHRFCSGCMNKSLRMGKKECPTCRIPCSSRRNMRPDPNFDNLIRVLYPNLEQYELQEANFIQQINNEYVAKAGMAATVEMGMKRQQQAAKRVREKSALDYAPVPKEKKKDKPKKGAELKPKKTKSDTNSPATSPPPVTTSIASLTPPPPKARQPVPQPQEDVSIAIAPYPGEKTLPYVPRPFLRIPAAACVRHITKFLALKFPEVDPAFIKVVLGTGVSESIKFAKREPGVVVNLEDLETVKKEGKYLTEDVALPTLKKTWNRREEILLLYFLLPEDGASGAAVDDKQSLDAKVTIKTIS